MPGSWVPHCTLAQEMSEDQLGAGVAALHPVQPVRAHVVEIGVTDIATGEIDTMLAV